MYLLAKIILSLFPVIALILLIIGIKKNTISFVISSLWLSIIALGVRYQISGGDILGDYFNYINAAIYSFNLIILFVSLIRIIDHLNSENSFFKYTNKLIQSITVIGSLLVIANVWINAYFIENKMEGTPVIQVALVHKPAYCSARYIFYKVTPKGTVAYLCPNYYGLIPSTGHLSISPDFISTQLSMQNKTIPNKD